jgi:hypothetical protein
VAYPQQNTVTDYQRSRIMRYFLASVCPTYSRKTRIGRSLAIYDYGFWSLAMASSGRQCDAIYSIFLSFPPLLLSVPYYSISQIDTPFQTPFLCQVCVSSDINCTRIFPKPSHLCLRRSWLCKTSRDHIALLLPSHHEPSQPPTHFTPNISDTL